MGAKFERKKNAPPCEGAHHAPRAEDNGRETRDPRPTINRRGVRCSGMVSQEQTKKYQGVDPRKKGNRPEDIADDKERAHHSSAVE